MKEEDVFNSLFLLFFFTLGANTPAEGQVGVVVPGAGAV